MNEVHKERPTGFAPTALPFQDLDDGAFEQFCTDMLNLHPVILCLRDGEVSSRRILASTRLLSGTSQRGADVRADAEHGEVWFFQCKRTKTFGPAQVARAIDLAEKGFPQADQFVLVTTCGLSEEAQGKIHERQKWRWWGASELTVEILKVRPRENAINLVHQFFGPDVAKELFLCGDQPLLTWERFFAQDLLSERQHFHHNIPFVPWSDTLAQLETFAHTGAGRALILSSAGGQGKSRLLLELAKRLEQQPQAPRDRFLNLNRHGLTAGQSNFLAGEDEDLLLIVDDAHRLDAAIQDIARATTESKSIRLLVATRPQALEAVRSHLYQNGYAERIEEPLLLPGWKSDSIHTLAEKVLDPPYRLQAERLARLADRCPLLVVLGGALINSGAWPEAMTDGEAFRERVFRSFKEGFLGLQSEGKRERLDRVISFLSFVSPTPKNETLLNKAAEVLGCSPFDIDEDLGALQAARLIVENREGIRLYPDLFADAVLLDACLAQGGRSSFLHRTILSKLPIDNFPALMRNVAQADWEARAKVTEKGLLFAPIWNEFIRRFNEGSWAADDAMDFDKLLLESHTESPPDVRRLDRRKLLRQWASFAVFLPERTLELAELAIKSVEPASSAEAESAPIRTEARASVCDALPSLLKPLVIWHHEYARRALDLLWSLDADEPRGDWANSSNAIAAIADAASFAIQKPLKTSEIVIEWLEQRFEEPAALERLRHQPWILSGLLKPFFGRAVEHNWATGRTLHISSFPVAADRTRPLRQRALAITDSFLNSEDVAFCHAIIPVIEEALHPIIGRFGSVPSEADQQSWRSDRLEVVRIVETAASTHRESPVLLLQLRRILWSRCEYDPDAIVRDECKRVFSQMPDTFELRVARVLTSWAHDEIRVTSGPTCDSDLKAAEKQWLEFRRLVARETVERFTTAAALCEFVRRQVRELAAANQSVLGGALLDTIAEISPIWSAALLEELLGAEDGTLDGVLRPVIHQAASLAPEAYRKAIESLPGRGRPEQLCSLITYFGWKQLHGGGLGSHERQAVLHATRRKEEAVMHSLASVAGLHFGNEPQWAMEVLCQLKPRGHRDGDEIMEALGQLTAKHAAVLEPEKVAQCLGNVGEFCFPERVSDQRDLEKVATAFPKQVYEHVRGLHERAEAKLMERRWPAEALALGPINDSEYVEQEISTLWENAIRAETGSFAETFRSALIRSLLWVDGETGPGRIRKLIAGCKNGDELKLATKLAAARSSTFVFQFPDIVRSLLVSSKEFAVGDAVRETLWLSACGGRRSFTNHELDPEYRYVLEQGEAMANRHRDDVVLGEFYRMIADSERHRLERTKQAFPDEEELE